MSITDPAATALPARRRSSSAEFSATPTGKSLLRPLRASYVANPINRQPSPRTLPFADAVFADAKEGAFPLLSEALIAAMHTTAA